MYIAKETELACSQEMIVTIVQLDAGYLYEEISSFPLISLRSHFVSRANVRSISLFVYSSIDVFVRVFIDRCLRSCIHRSISFTMKKSMNLPWKLTRLMSKKERDQFIAGYFALHSVDHVEALVSILLIPNENLKGSARILCFQDLTEKLSGSCYKT